MNELIEVRCPFQIKSRVGIMYPCNRLIVKVFPGSSGEAHCTQCKLTFEFDVRNQNTVATRIKAKAVL